MIIERVTVRFFLPEIAYDFYHSVQRLGSEWSHIFSELSDLLDNSEIRWV